MMRTDRNNNPIAAAVRAGGTNSFTKALNAAGIPWTYGDAFPGDPSMVTIKILGDPVEGARAILANTSAYQDWYINHTGMWASTQFGIKDNADFAALTQEQQDAVIAGIYQREGGSGSLVANRGSSLSFPPSLVPTPPDLEASLTPPAVETPIPDLSGGRRASRSRPGGSRKRFDERAEWHYHCRSSFYRHRRRDVVLLPRLDGVGIGPIP